MSHNKGLSFGTNGTAQVALEASGSALLALFVRLCRGFDVNLIHQDVAAIVAGATNNVDALADLFVLAFQTRDCRGGKGERDLFRALVLELYKHFPAEVVGALPLIREYGYFKDYTALWLDIQKSGRAAEFADLSNALVECFATTLKADFAKLQAASAAKSDPKGLSLAAKYAPRIQKKKRKADTGDVVVKPNRVFACAVRDRIFAYQNGEVPHDASMRYRKMLSALNEALLTVERLMSTNRWDEIEIGRVPALCMKRSRKAFLYEDKKTNAIIDETNETRMALRNKLLAPKNKGKIKGGQLFAHNIVAEAMRGHQMSEGDITVLDAQWNDLVANVKKQIDEFAAQANTDNTDTATAGGATATATSAPERPAFDLGNLVPLVDVSGSMSGTPMEVAVAMGLIVSQLTAPAFQGRVLTFQSVPQWHVIQGANIVEKVRNLMSAPWGTSTNFRAAMFRVINTLKQLALNTGQMPDIPELIVFSDMQFDQAGDTVWDTAYESIKQDFRQLGKELRAKGIDTGGEVEPPTITFWNINASTTGLVTDANAKGVRLLAGFSQTLLKLLLSGALPGAATENDSEAVDPLATLRAALDDNRYDAVRLYLSSMTSGPFAGYSFEPPPPAADAEAEAPPLPSAGGAGKP